MSICVNLCHFVSLFVNLCVALCVNFCKLGQIVSLCVNLCQRELFDLSKHIKGKILILFFTYRMRY